MTKNKCRFYCPQSSSEPSWCFSEISRICKNFPLCESTAGTLIREGAYPKKAFAW